MQFYHRLFGKHGRAWSFGGVVNAQRQMFTLDAVDDTYVLLFLVARNLILCYFCYSPFLHWVQLRGCTGLQQILLKLFSLSTASTNGFLDYFYYEYIKDSIIKEYFIGLWDKKCILLRSKFDDFSASRFVDSQSEARK